MNQILHLEGLRKVEKVPWKDVQPGMIFLGGIRINDTVPFELRDFPVLSPSLLEELSKKYYFLSRRDILIVKAKTGYSPSKLSKKLLESRGMIDKVNTCRSAFVSAKQTLFAARDMSVSLDTPLCETEVVEQGMLINNHYNSFNNPFGSIDPFGSLDPFGSIDPMRIPSLFHDINTSISLAHILTHKIQSHFNMPMDEDVLLHLVVDCSAGMEQEGKHAAVFTCLDFFYTHIRDVLKNTEINLYAFSQECKPVHYPMSGKEVPKRDSRYGTFIKKVLHYKDTNRRNKVLLFTDKEPSDPDDAARYGRLFKKNKIDYTQVILRDSASEYPGGDNKDDHADLWCPGCARFVDICGGNQIVLRFREGAAVAALECFDRYIGQLTFLDPSYYREKKVKQTEQVKQTRGYEQKTGKVVKKWQPKVIKRGP